VTIAETERLRIRPLTVEDSAFVLELVNDPTFLAGIGDRGLRTLEDARRFLRRGHWTRQTRPGHGQFLVELRESGEAVGICGLLFRPALGETDVGFALLERHHGRGYAFEAAAAVIAYGRTELGLERIVGIVAPGNAPSIRVLEKLGLRYEKRVRVSADAPESALYA